MKSGESSVSMGILMVDSQFDRLHGDIGNPSTWPFPVTYQIVKGATPAQMINLQSTDALQGFLQAAEVLVSKGVSGITTTCGFLGLYQQVLANHCPVPVATSALLQVPVVARLLPASKRVGILTYNASALTDAHLHAVGAAVDTPIIGLNQQSLFYRWIMQGLQDPPIDQLRNDVVDMAIELTSTFQDIGAIVSECTNLTPFARDITLATGLPVYDMVTLMHWFHAGLNPVNFLNTRQ